MIDCYHFVGDDNYLRKSFTNSLCKLTENREYIGQVRPINKSGSFSHFEWIFFYDNMREAKDYSYSDVCTELSTVLKIDSTRKWLQSRVCPDS